MSCTTWKKTSIMMSMITIHSSLFECELCSSLASMSTAAAETRTLVFQSALEGLRGWLMRLANEGG